MKRIHFLLLGLGVAFCIAAASPTLPPTRIAPGTNITVVTNGVNNFTLSASGGISAMNQNQFDSTSTNFASGALTTNLNVKQSSGNAFTVNTNQFVVATNKVGINTATPVGESYQTAALLNLHGDTSAVRLTGSIGTGANKGTSLYYNQTFYIWNHDGEVQVYNGEVAIADFKTTGLNTALGYSMAATTTGAPDVMLHRNAANTFEIDSGTSGIANRGTVLAAKYTGRAGTSTSPFNAGGLIWIDTTTTENSGAAETVILTNNFGANVFAATGDSIDLNISGFMTNSVNTRTFKLYVAGQEVYTSQGTHVATSDAPWKLISTITRTSSTNLNVSTALIVDYPATGSQNQLQDTNVVVGLTTNNPVKLTGTGGASADIVRRIGRANFLPAP